MAKSLKQYSPAMQLVLLISFCIALFILNTIIYFVIYPLLTGYSMTDLRTPDVSKPNVSITLKITTFYSPLLMYLIPALLFIRLVSRQPMEWLRLNKPVQRWHALFVIVLLLLAVPLSGILYDWNCTWGIAKSSIREVEKMAAINDALMEMPNIGYLFINLLLFVLVPAIAKECFFRGVLQQVFIRMLPKAPWLAIIITSVIYSASYFQWQWLASMTLIGILLGSIYYFTENLRLAILGNSIFSSLNVVHSYILQQGWSNENPLYPSTTPWYAAIISLMLIVALLWYFRRKIPRPVPQIAYQEEVESIGK